LVFDSKRRTKTEGFSEQNAEVNTWTERDEIIRSWGQLLNEELRNL
jgi:hypothetical protein